KAVPRQGPGVILLYALPVLIHPAELVFCGAVSERGRFKKPRPSFGIVDRNTDAMLKVIADVFHGLVVAMFRGFVIPGKSFFVSLRLAPSFFCHEAEIGFAVGAAVTDGAAIPVYRLSIVALNAPSALVKVADF